MNKEYIFPDIEDEEIWREKLIGRWKKLWERDDASNPAGWNIRNSDDYFKDIFPQVYYLVFTKKRCNKFKNDFFKALFLFIIFAEIIGYIMLFIKTFSLQWLISVESDTIQNLKELSLGFVGIAIIIDAVVAKWLGVKKYQETWSRHSRHLQLMDHEIWLFIYGMTPYDHNDRNEVFLQNILTIWGANQKLFCNNMENKEEKLMDIFEAFIKREK